jgi:hypothetical protein
MNKLLPFILSILLTATLVLSGCIKTEYVTVTETTTVTVTITETATSNTIELSWQNPLPQGNSLHGVWGSSPSDVFAVGDAGTILHYNGTSWSIMTSGTTCSLSDIWGSSSTDVFAVGHDGTILHYDGSNWHPMNTGTNDNISAVWGSSPSDGKRLGIPVSSRLAAIWSTSTICGVVLHQTSLQ